MTLLDATLRVPVKWFVFTLFSLVGYLRILQVSLLFFLLFTFVAATIDTFVHALFMHFLPPGWLPVAANAVVLAYLIGAVRGFSASSWALWNFFMAIDMFKKQSAYDPSHLPMYVDLARDAATRRR